MNNTATILRSNITPNHESVKYWADLNADPSGGIIKFFNGNKWELVNGASNDNPKLDAVIKEQQATIKNLEARVKSLGVDLENIGKYAMGLETKLNNLINERNS